MYIDREMFEVVDENDNVIGLESREKIHREGLLHREVHVIFVTKDKGIIFQHRAKDKASMPDKLDATAGGHVDPGENILTAALRETKEETGVGVKLEEVVWSGIIRSSIYEPNTGVINNIIRTCYGYLFDGNLEDLKIEEGKIIEFVKYKFEDLKYLKDEERVKFIPERLEKSYMDIYEEIFKKLNLI
jgi:8-oxo-dGTP pyrophosphatase MutT (NUDIX family)